MGYEGITVAEQLAILGGAAVLGFSLGLVFELFRFLRLLFGGGKITVFVHDVLFWLVALVTTFVFAIAFNEGQLRYYILLGELFGFVVYYHSLGKLLFFLTKTSLKTIRRLLNFATKPLRSLVKRRKTNILPKKQQKSRKFLKKVEIFFKKHLKLTKGM